ncbi:TRAF-type domain-containing protein [Plasmodiophora brassicae]
MRAVSVLVLAGALWVLVGGMGGSRKEGDFLRRHAACRRDRQRFCGHVRHLVPVLGCMRDHETELEPACSASLKKCPAYKCSRDAMRLCPHVRKHDQILSCMWRNRQSGSLSAECTGTAYKPTNFDDDRHVCHGDRVSRCRDATTLAGIMSCLYEKRDELGGRCGDVVKKCPAFPCADDAAKFCPHVDNEHDFMKCIYEHKPELSSSQCKLGHARDDLVPLTHDHSACKEDRERLCKDSQGYVQKMSCLMHNESELSDKCKAIMSKCPLFRCADDVIKLCPKTSTHRGFVACLWKHRKDLSAQCMNQPERGEDVCRGDRHRFCESADDIDKCLREHVNRLSTRCRQSVNIVNKCKHELEQFCTPKDTYPFTCLQHHRDKLGFTCQQALRSIEDDVHPTSVHGDDDLGKKIEKEAAQAPRVTLFAAGAILGGVTTGLVIWAVSALMAARKRRRQAYLAAAGPAPYQRI